MAASTAAVAPRRVEKLKGVPGLENTSKSCSNLQLQEHVQWNHKTAKKTGRYPSRLDII